MILGKDATYDPASAGKVIVKQFLKYEPRPTENVNVIRHFQTRQDERLSDPDGGHDKQLNPVVAIPAAPGSGKSTFLAKDANLGNVRESCRAVCRVLHPYL